MQPCLDARQYVFCTLDEDTFSRLAVRPLGMFQEPEGITVILEAGQAEVLGLPDAPVFACITLAVHSDLLAVGFLAAVTTRLANAGISVNAVSAFYHDHLFVPASDANQAMDLLAELAREHQE